MCMHKLLNLSTCISISALFAGTQVIAQEHPVYRLNLDDALGLAEKNNASIIKSGIETEISEEETKEAKELRLPDFDFNATYSRVSNITEFTSGNFSNKKITRPLNWGGYIVQPVSVEFWQGRESRLHDRIQYTLQEGGNWMIERLAP